MADKSNISKKQLRKAIDRADKRLDALELGKADKVSSVSVTIPTSAWASNTDTTTKAAGFAYYADVTVAGLTAADSADTVLDYASLAIAKAAGVSNTATPRAGAIRYYAVAKPTAALTATVRIFQGKA